MRKYLLIAALLLSCLKDFSQYSEGLRRDNLRMDDLIQKLPQLKDSARIDTMLLLCIYYRYGSRGTGEITTAADSVRYYATKAFNESKRIGYKRGIRCHIKNGGLFISVSGIIDKLLLHRS